MVPSLPPELRQPEQAYIYYMKDISAFHKNSFLGSNLFETYTSKQNIEISIEIQISNKIRTLGYTIAEIVETSFKELGEDFKVYTVELNDTITNYADLYKQEKEIRKDLGLTDKNIILELI